MSDNYISRGYFGKLKTPVGDDDQYKWEAINEFLQKHDLALNYAGTLIYSNEQKPSYDVDGLMFVDPVGAVVFREKCKELGHDVDPVKHYVCQWYNGSDSPMNTASIEEVFA